MRPSEKAWLGVAVGVGVYDSLCPQGETMSERYEQWLADPRFRYVAIGGLALVSGHLLGVIPEQFDPIHNLLRWKHDKGEMER